jgi:hydrogenase nickel incorporation protein HypA/HybF
MHEFSIALNIIEIVTAEVEKLQAEKVRVVEIEIGQASGVVREALEFALESAVKNTIMEDASIIIYEIPSLAECNSCKHKFNLEGTIAICPECGDVTANLLSGREMKIRSITVY